MTSLQLRITAAIVALLVVPMSLPASESTTDWRLTRNLYIILDASGSMYERKCTGGDMKINVAKQALVTFLGSVDDATNLGFYTFDERGPHEVIPLGKVDRASLIERIKAIRAGGNTPLPESIDAARTALLKQKNEQLGYGDYTLLVVTDGESTSRRSLAEPVRLATENGIVVQVIGFCLDGAHSLKSLVNKYREANSPEELKSALQAVLGEAESYQDSREFESGK